MSDDIIVRSIRVATALNERVGELLRPGSPEEVANRVGELRQIYPEVWSHLDDARKQLAARGHDVTAYDALRASRVANSDVLDVVGNDAGEATGAYLTTERHTLATEAIYLLRAELPHVDWVGLEEAEARELAAFGSLGPAMWKKVVLGVIGLGIVGVGGAIFLYLYVFAGGE